MTNYLVIATTILVAMFWFYRAFAADYSYYQPQPAPQVYYAPTLVPAPYDDESNFGTGCRPGCTCEFDALGKPEVDCTGE